MAASIMIWVGAVAKPNGNPTPCIRQLMPVSFTFKKLLEGDHLVLGRIHHLDRSSFCNITE